MNPRQEINAQILAILTAYNERSPDQRFIQLLVNTGVLVPMHNTDGTVQAYHNLYHEEPARTLTRIGERMMLLRKEEK